MHDFSRFLPACFQADMPLQKKPIELFDMLQNLYNQERKIDPKNDYLPVHGAPLAIVDKIYTFDWYFPFLPAHGKILDWGCNHAPDSCLLRSVCGDNLEIHACDFRDPNMFPTFSKAAKMEYRKLSDPIKLPYENNFFDTVVASGSLEHAVCDYESLQELYRVLKPEGKLIISYLPNRYSWFEWKMEKIRHSNFHIRRYSIAETKKLLMHNGFYPINFGYQTFIWERKLASMGFKGKGQRGSKILSKIFPIHLISGCLKFVAVKMTSM